MKPRVYQVPVSWQSRDTVIAVVQGCLSRCFLVDI